MTRAEQILKQIDEVVPIAVPAIGAALTAANIAHQVYQAKRRTREKVAQAGLGAEHDAARKHLRDLRVKQVKRLGLSGKVAGQVAVQKKKIKDIQNTGLERFHKGLAQNPQQHAEVKRDVASS